MSERDRAPTRETPTGPAGPTGATPEATAVARTSVVQTFLAPGQIRLPASPPLSLYVHFPWCVRKCPYCDFNSHEPGAQGIPESAYVDALIADLEAALPLVWGRRVHTVFIGGGTPSLLSAAGLDRLLCELRARLPIDPDAEITLEANPGTFEAERFAAYRASGVNRLSIGVQSFNDEHLRALGRIHGAQDARAAIEIAQRNFDNFNLDLMYALPGQTLSDCQTDIETALSFEPPHLSLYHLTLEPNTYFHKYPPVVPDEDASADMQEWLEARTAAAGYQHYEVSAYARPGHRSRHNLNYWEFGDYLGIGAGAHGKLSFPERILRQVRYKQPQSYMDHALRGDAVQEAHEIAARDLPFEFMLNALRLIDGVDSERFHERTGLPLISIERTLRAAEARGLLARDEQRIAPTELGTRFLNDLQEMFLREKKSDRR